MSGLFSELGEGAWPFFCVEKIVCDFHIFGKSSAQFLHFGETIVQHSHKGEENFGKTPLQSPRGDNYIEISAVQSANNAMKRYINCLPSGTIPQLCQNFQGKVKFWGKLYDLKEILFWGSGLYKAAAI